MKITMLLVFVLTMFSFSANAFRAQSNSGGDLGLFNQIKCGASVSCSRSSSQLLVEVGSRSLVAATAVTIAASQCGSAFYNTAAVIISLPEASTVPGCILTFVTLNASNFDVDPENSDLILNSTNVAGDRSRNATVGSSLVLMAISASQWVVLSINGTWADAN